jgi:hypothetical protein
MTKQFDPNKYIDPAETQPKEETVSNKEEPKTPDNSEAVDQTNDANSSEENTIEIYGPIAKIVATALMTKYNKSQVDYDEIEKKYTLKSDEITSNKTIYATTPKEVNKEPLVQYESIKQRQYDIVYLDSNGYVFKTKEDEWFLNNTGENKCYTIPSLLSKV